MKLSFGFGSFDRNAIQSDATLQGAASSGRKTVIRERSMFAGEFALSGSAAFTLLEIMIVVIIIGALTAVALPSFSKVRTTSRILQAQHDLGILHAAVDRLAWDTGCWPGMSYQTSPSRAKDAWGWPIAWALVPNLGTTYAGIVAADNTFSNKNWKGPYLSTDAIPLDPWGSRYWFDPEYFVWTNDHWEIWAVVGSLGPNRGGWWWNDGDNVVDYLQKYWP